MGNYKIFVIVRKEGVNLRIVIRSKKEKNVNKLMFL